MYAIVYSLGASRCIILHLATAESLQHAMGGKDQSLLMYSLIVAGVALVMVQARPLSSPSAVHDLAAAQVVAVGYLGAAPPQEDIRLPLSDSSHSTYLDACGSAVGHDWGNKPL